MFFEEITIEFGKSGSKYYSAAVETASSYPSYIVTGEGKNIRHKVTFAYPDMKLFYELYDVVGNWKNTEITIDGNPASLKELKELDERKKVMDSDTGVLEIAWFSASFLPLLALGSIMLVFTFFLIKSLF